MTVDGAGPKLDGWGVVVVHYQRAVSVPVCMAGDVDIAGVSTGLEDKDLAEAVGMGDLAGGTGAGLMGFAGGDGTVLVAEQCRCGSEALRKTTWFDSVADGVGWGLDGTERGDRAGLEDEYIARCVGVVIGGARGAGDGVYCSPVDDDAVFEHLVGVLFDVGIVRRDVTWNCTVSRGIVDAESISGGEPGVARGVVYAGEERFHRDG